MIPTEGGANSNLAKVDTGTIARQERPLSIGELELKLLARFPREDAEPWDRTGLLVGDPAALVTGVTVALDPTSDVIEMARSAGTNVVLTHHPAFLDPPTAFSPSRAVASASGVNVYKAISEDVALMNFHTTLDVSSEAIEVLPGMLGLVREGVLVPLPQDSKRGYGQICSVRDSDKPFRLSHLAARCTSVFGRLPRVWGDFTKKIETVVVANGSAGNVVDAAVEHGVDCVVCGEIRYHAALDASQAGLTIVELGHDASEIPLTAVLAKAAIEAGVPKKHVVVADQSKNWITPDSTRI